MNIVHPQLYVVHMCADVAIVVAFSDFDSVRTSAVLITYINTDMM